MRRRDLLIALSGTLSALSARVSLAQGQKRSAAVVVGVDKPDGLQALSGAASGAKDVADWLSGEHFDVTLLSDHQKPNELPKPVHADDVARAVQAVVDRGVYDQFVLYFAGHGLLQNYDEIWVLSGAPRNPGDAIGFNGSAALALLSGIPNVIIISDCCRTIPSGAPLAFVSGRPAFPASSPTPGKAVKIDHFCATTIGAAAYEVSLDKRVKDYKGIFTSAIMSAFQSPEDTFVTTVDGQQVINDTNLAMYLDAEVPRRARAANIAEGQYPQNSVGPDPKNYLARVHGPVRHAANAPTPAPTLSALASISLAQWGGHLAGPVPLTPELRNLSEKVGFDASTEKILVAARGAAELHTQIRSGFSVWGRRVTSVITQPGVDSTTVNASTSGVSVTIDHGRAATVGLVFDDGCGCVLPAIEGFLARVTVDEQGISDVTYSPTWMDADPQLEKYRATVATAARYGVFKIQDRATAEQVARTIRQGKMFDCTLGVYAAYAYAQAGMLDGVRSVNAALKGEYGATFFDVAMLADELREVQGALRHKTLLPFCPMLAQGWSLLQAKQVTLPEPLREVQHYTKLALWTTFNPAGMRMVVDYMRNTATKVT